VLTLIRKLPGIRLIWPLKPIPIRIEHRVAGNNVAIVFVHGFSGNIIKTWAGFVGFLLKEPSVTTWDILSLGFPSSMRVDVPGIWASDPGLALIAKELRTSLTTPPLKKYRSIALIAHSMGGLIAQRALLDDEKLRARVTHLLLYGTPSGGLIKARMLGWLKRQFNDMAKDGSFISTLRADWDMQFPQGPNFFFRTIAGDRDEFVPATSSIEPFDERFREVVQGHHLSIIQPASADAVSVQILVDSLSGRARVRPAVDGALIAVEQGRFQEVVEKWFPRAAELDEAALADLALALDGLGRGDQALAVLESRPSLAFSDPKGILAGRFKRRWLLHRSDNDRKRARELYLQALDEAQAENDHDQAYYHAINIAFIDLMASPAATAVPNSAREMAQRALEYCAKGQSKQWRLATAGEAKLVLGDLSRATDLYRQAVSEAKSPRDLDSMYSQASQVAFRIFGEDGLLSIEQVFGLANRDEQ
jgi:pimeloyl-ACP methyl ester carboxylesterase